MSHARSTRRGAPATRALALALCVPLLFAPGCATIVASGPDLVPVSSTPDGATVTLDGIPVGRTPMTVAFERDCDGVLRLDKPGYQVLTIDRDKVLNGWFLGNVLIGGLIGITIDLCTSNQGKYSTKPILVTLVPAEGAP